MAHQSYKVVRTHDHGEAGRIKTLDADYDEKNAEASEVAGGKFLAATFLLGVNIRQYGGVIRFDRPTRKRCRRPRTC